MPALPSLPIDAHLEAIADSLHEANCLIIEAPPGTGKTTRVAPSLLRTGPTSTTTTVNDTEAGKILLVQPRRIAARASAARISHELGTSVGKRVGYQVRFDNCVGRETELICMTPGILLRRLQRDSILEDVAVVVLDEFHERSLEYDVLLGMLRRIQTQLRDELKIIVMSATLDGDAVGTYLADAPRIIVAANAFPVRIEHANFSATSPRGGLTNSSRRIVEQMTEAIRTATRAEEGDLLAFLPGAGEIKQVESSLQTDAERNQWKLLPLFGDMHSEEQDQVLQPCRQRKIILATNIAETSLTIDGVRIVVDSGWARVQRIDPGLALNRLMLEPISKASATQRAGRAGRTAPGVCFRLWDEITGRNRSEQLDPEVRRVDLTGAVLQLICWGERDIEDFPWITQPHDQSITQALKTLEMLDAVVDRNATKIGHQLLSLPVHPRLAKLLIEGHRLGIPRQAAVAAAILSERDILQRETRNAVPNNQTAEHCDVSRRVRLVMNYHRNHGSTEQLINLSAVHQVRRVSDQLVQSLFEQFGECTELAMEDRLRQAILVAFPDRIAKRRAATSQRGVMVGGRGVQVSPASVVTRAELFTCVDLDARGSEATVRIASEVDPSWLTGRNARVLDEKFFNPTLNAVVTRRRNYWCDLILSEVPVETATDEETARLLAQAAAPNFARLLPPKDKELRSWLDRIQWLSAAMPDAGLPNLDSETVTSLLENWCFGFRTIDEVKSLPWASLLPNILDASQRKTLDTHAPQTIQLPNGRQVLLKYEINSPPVLAARIQEFFGWPDTPKLAQGRVKLLMHLLAPNGRVHQITDDLASFWRNTYPSVRKELRGRYPKHAWPENPLNAEPNRGSTKRTPK